MADPILPAMVPADGAGWRLLGLLCWARRDSLPPYGTTEEPWSPYGTACGGTPASSLGLCAHHRTTVFPEARSNAS